MDPNHHSNLQKYLDHLIVLRIASSSTLSISPMSYLSITVTNRYVFNSCSRKFIQHPASGESLGLGWEENVTLHVRLSCSAHRLEHRWSKVMQHLRGPQGLDFPHVVEPSKGLEDKFFMDEMCGYGRSGRSFGSGVGLDCVWRKRHGRSIMVIPE